MAGIWCRRRRLASHLGVFALVVLLGSYAAAQTVYKWTDDDGVVHFSDNPPANGTQFEKRDVPPPPPPPAEAGGGAANMSGAGGEKFEGPARVILTKNDSFPRGDNSRHVIGVVKNVGGATASNVRVTAHITDAEGNECASEDFSVTPSSLEPGASGNFDTTIDSPCFADGGGSVDAAPQWE
jgi:hypothetical protein